MRTRAILSVLGLGLAAVAHACGGEPTRPFTPGPEGRVVYQDAPHVIARLAEERDFDRSLLSPAGDATTADGGAVAAFVCRDEGRDRCLAASWEIVTESEAGWQVWEPAAVAAARRDLADRLDLSEADILVTQVAAVDWPDACLGLPRPQEACAEVITPGFLVRLQAQGVPYEYHTDLTGERLRRLGAPADSPEPSEEGGGPKRNRDAAVAAAIGDLAHELGIATGDIDVAGVEERQSLDACLGLAAPGEFCAQVITPGFAITLRAGDVLSVYRTNTDGSVLRRER